MHKGLVILFTLTSFWLQGQKLEQGQYEPDYDTNYIQDFRHRLNIALLFGAKENTMLGATPAEKSIFYRTNMPLPNYGVMLSYHWVNIAFTIPIPGLSYYDDQGVETYNWNLGVGFTGRHWYARGFYEYFKGYYVANPDIIIPPFDSILDVSIIEPSLETTTINFNAYYGFNGERYSHRSLLWQSELQKKSAGTFLIGAVGGYRSIKSDKVFSYSSEYSDFVDYLDYIYVGINAGYTHTFVLAKNLTFSAMLMPGFNLLYGEYSNKIRTPQQIKNGVGLNTEFRLQLLYEIGDVYMGSSFTAYAFSSWVDPERPVGYSYSYLRFNVGYRFRLKPIKFLKPFYLSN